MQTGTILGFDIGGTKTAVLEGRFDGSILQRAELPTRSHRSFHDSFPDLLDAAERLRNESEKNGRRIAAVGVSVGGPLHIEDGILIDPPHLPGWHGIHLKQAIAEALPGLPVYIEHDGNAGALAEYHFGAGKDQDIRHMIFLTFGTGLGAGIIVDGRILCGATDTAGEVGHWRLADDGPEGFGKKGSWEGFASGRGLVLLASQRFPHRWTPESPIRDVVSAMLADDPEALESAREAGAWMGRGIALLVDAFNPELIVLGSLAVVLGDRILEPAREVVRREALPQAAAACRIVPAALGSRIGDVAALIPAITRRRVF